MKHFAEYGYLFGYPEKNLPEVCTRVNHSLIERYRDLSSKFQPFISFVNSKTTNELQEYYIRTFDIHASCYLDIGYVLFGEDYKRGEFLVNMRNEHQNAGSDCGTELADHLPNFLSLLPKIKDKDLAERLAFCILIPALKEMNKNFIDETNVYKPLIEILFIMLERDFGHLKYPQLKIMDKDKTNFLNNINCSTQKCGVKHTQTL